MAVYRRHKHCIKSGHLIHFIIPSNASGYHLHQRLLRQFRRFKGDGTSHVGCDRIRETVTRTGRGLEAIQIGACLGVAAGEGACRTD